MTILLRIDAWLSSRRHGRGVELRWHGPAAPIWAILNRYGVKTYAPQMHADGVRSCRVPTAQGRWAEYVLRRAGMPMVGDAIYDSNRNVKPGPMPVAWEVAARPVGFAGAVFAVFHRTQIAAMIQRVLRLFRRA